MPDPPPGNSASVECNVGAEWQEVYSDAFLSQFNKQESVHRIERALPSHASPRPLSGQKRGKFDVDSLFTREKVSDSSRFSV